MFLHVTNGEPTMGCVAIERELMKQILVWLDPAKVPKITIGVNQGAPAGDAPGATPQTAPGTTPGTTPPTTSGVPGADVLTGLLSQLVGVVPALFGLGGQAG